MTPVIIAPPIYYSLDETELALVVNGCGPGGFLEKIIPDKPLGIDFGESCSVHDFEYSYSGNRGEADYNFLMNCINAVFYSFKTPSWYLLFQVLLGLPIAVLYFLAVSYCGDKYFEGVE